jgi:hypothetical protein
MHSNLQYLPRNQVDTGKWDRCIDTASNTLIYGYSWYLDGMARHWDALVWKDYEAVMPLTWNRKWGIAYLYQPPFVQQLGIFSTHALTVEMEQAFLDELPERFRFAEIFLNYAHPRNTEPRPNFILTLNRSYDQLRACYKKDLLKNLKRAAQFNLTYTTQVAVDVVLDAFEKLYGARLPHIERDDYARFKKMCLSKGRQVIVRAAMENEEVLCAALLLRDRKRLYLLHSVTWPVGRDKEANHFLLDMIISEFAGTDLIMDFEGSDVPGIAMFYRNFGSVDQPYFFYRYNHLPPVIRWLKR